MEHVPVPLGMWSQVGVLMTVSAEYTRHVLKALIATNKETVFQ